MIRFAIPPIGGKNWFGGWNYMCNMVRSLAEYGGPDLETVLFVGPDRANDPYVVGLFDLPRTRVVIHRAFAEDVLRSNLVWPLIAGRNSPILDAYSDNMVDVAFAPAIYHGWRSRLPTIAWFPDFQHRRMPHMFTRNAWWKRELGYRAQVAASERILLSSNDAERDCLHYYPAAQGRTFVARFAVPIESWASPEAAWRMLREAGLPEDFIFLPNQLWQHKNHLLAVEAAGLLAKRKSDRVILATGWGEDPRRPGYRAEIEARILELGAGDNIKLLGNVDHKIVQAMMICCNALLNPSRFEGWSTTVEEAKAVGTPLILSDLPVHREQAPRARFFDVDDAEALANAVAVASPRSLKTIKDTAHNARQETVRRQSAFAQTVTKAVRSAIENRAS